MFHSEKVSFYEKPGCVGNQRQKSLLLDRGVRLVVRDLLSEPWSKETLRPFFNFEPVREWFNLSAPAVKEGWVEIDRLDEYRALELMLAQPILIRRPLLQLDDTLQAGFYQGPVMDALGVVLAEAVALQDCPMNVDAPDCGTLA